VTQLRQQPPAYTPPAAYYDYEEPRRRAFWPWLVALLFVAGAVVGGYFLYDQVQDQLSSATVPVANYTGLREVLAVEKIRDAGLQPNVIREPSTDVPETYVIRQSPSPGTKLNKGNEVTIYSSSGPPQVTVPDVTGDSLEVAVQRLADASLKWKIVHVESDQDEGTVVGQSPTDGASVDQGSKVTIRVSKGPQPVAVPNVVGHTFATANSELQAAGFAVARHNIASDQPADTVVSTEPPPGTYQPPGTTITVNVSKGPTTSTVPDVTSQDQASAVSQLRASGFRVHIVNQATTNPDEDGIVLSQDPSGGMQAPRGATVTISVGKLGAPTTPGPP
jgi:serine/threonine-protein kinase